MTTLTGIYHNGNLVLDKPLKTSKPIRVTILFDEEADQPSILKVSDFSFLETQKLLESVDTSFADEVVKERRKAV